MRERFPSTLHPQLSTAFRVVLAAFLACVLLLMIFEERLIFHPTRHPHGDWQPAGLAVEDAHFHSADGTALHGWFVEHDTPRAVVLFCHGNAGNVTHRADTLRVLHRELRLSVLVFDYRGYGRSKGRPHEAGVLADARAARAWLAERTGVPASEIVLLGRSLGGGVAVDLAAGDGARALILESTFTSLPDVAAGFYPWAPVHWLMRTRLDSKSKIAKFSGPVLQSHGDADEIVPFRLGQQLYEAIPHDDKRLVTLPGRMHNDPQPVTYYRELERFLEHVTGVAGRAG